MHTSLDARLLVLALACALPATACSGSTSPSDSGSRREVGASDDAFAMDFPDAVSGGDDAASDLDAPGLDAPESTDDSGLALMDSGPQADAGATACGGRGRPPCGAGTFCNFPPSSMCGRADGPGMCTPVPTMCTRERAPVCGCDGMTYGNACEAERASVSVESTGACPVRCDPDTVVCDRIPPRCTSGSVPSVATGCWTGDCVPIGECTCMTFEDCPDIRGVSEACYSRGVCGPLL